jgi:predicted alpha/beta superfamily hydrolase
MEEGFTGESGNRIHIMKKKKNPGRDEIIGTVELHENIYSRHLDSERTMIVWLPPKYKRLKNAEKKYPVLYMQDGQNLFDPKTSFAGKDWRVDETVVKLVKAGLMKEIIVVGIYNSEDRLEEYSDSEKGDKYLKFLIEEVKPFVDSVYRTLPGRENTAIIGSSMGGLASFLTAWKHPEIFSMAGCMSSSFYYNDEKVFKMLDEHSGSKKPVKFYIDHGEDGLIRGQKMFCRLTQMGYVIGSDLDYYYSPGAEHNESSWAERLERPLLFFFGKK